NSFNNIHEIYFYDESFGFVHSSDTLFRSTDGGNTWENNRNIAGYESHIHCYNSESCILYANDTLYKTTDKGLTWNPVSHPDLSQYDSYYYFKLKINKNGNGIFTAEKNRRFTASGNYEETLFTTSDFGNTWENKALIQDGGLITILDNDNIISLGYSYESDSYESSISTDGGDSWTSTTLNHDIYAIHDNGRYVAALCTTKANYVVLCSSDYGQTWITNEFSEPLYFADNIFVTPENIVYSFGSVRSTFNFEPRGYRSYNNISCFDVITSDKEVVKNTSGIYPNPSNGKFFMNLKFQDTYSVCDITGKEILKSTSSYFDLSNFKPGMYFVQYTNKNTLHTTRIVKK
ncbi:MAG: hypothetical protein CMP63_01760, partial [Flavobacteriales bacterium]|nr:hypothetical protein [Flavobacteriales bacterium]